MTLPKPKWSNKSGKLMSKKVSGHWSLQDKPRPCYQTPRLPPSDFSVLCNQPIRIEEVSLLFLGDTAEAVKTKPITKVSSNSLKPIQKTTGRIAAPSDFRVPFLETTADKPRLVVQELHNRILKFEHLRWQEAGGRKKLLDGQPYWHPSLTFPAKTLWPSHSMLERGEFCQCARSNAYE